ncbi:MAG: hypothetical protein ACOYUK_04945 [Patescibacteria group bacterium]
MIKWLFHGLVLCSVVACVIAGTPGAAADEQVADVTMYFFYSETCPHCAREEVFIDQLQSLYGDRLRVERYEISTPASLSLFYQFVAAFTEPINGVPATFIGSHVVVGYGGDTTTGAEIQGIIESCFQKNCPDTLVLVQGESLPEPSREVTPSERRMIELPFFGAIDTSAYPLFGLTVVIAAVDGFNPCAMWVLLILIGLLLGMQNRRRMWLLGVTFIAASAMVYFIFLAAWLELFRFVGIVRWLQILVGLGALGVGAYYLRRFVKSRPGVCEVTNVEQKRKITDRIKRVVHERTLWLAIPGIIGVAFVVNLIELMCSAGLPAVYTQVLSLSELSRVSYYGYLLLYVCIFMLDDLVVFFIAMVTMKAIGTEGKWSRYATLVGGVAILIIGILLIIDPTLLSFGG